MSGGLASLSGQILMSVGRFFCQGRECRGRARVDGGVKTVRVSLMMFRSQRERGRMRGRESPLLLPTRVYGFKSTEGGRGTGTDWLAILNGKMEGAAG